MHCPILSVCWGGYSEARKARSLSTLIGERERYKKGLLSRGLVAIGRLVFTFRDVGRHFLFASGGRGSEWFVM
jgi:hypothetical protein